MDDDEDFRALYFNECEDLVEDLQNQLSVIADGEHDDDSIHAAFRAVHSVKGGAAAFGFEALINYAHTFEAVMDLARSGQLDLSVELAELLLRGSDTMETLIIRARDEDDTEVPSLEPVLAELRAHLGESPPAAKAEKKKEEPKAAEPEVVEEEMPEEHSYSVLFTPMDSFYQSGLDMMKVIATAKEFDLLSAEPVGEIPELDALDLEKSLLSWRFSFETAHTKSDLEAFFNVYEAASEYEFEEINDAEEKPAEPAPVSKSEPEPVTQKTEPEATVEAPVVTKPAAKSGTKKQAKSGDQGKSLRVDLLRVDRLVNLVGEIAITQASLVQTFSESELSLDAALEQTIDSLTRQTRDLQDSVMAIRAQPVKVVFSRMPRVIRELCEQLGKKVKLEIEGELTEVDTTIIEELSEPLIHMLRNSMDHGLENPEVRKERGKSETGKIVLKAEHRGERVMIIISDDGAGINREVVLQKAYSKGLIAQDEKLSPEEVDNLIFHPGFSTAETVSSVSGRGVGMDVVRRKIVELGGRCTLKNEPGKGCTFTIALPLTLAVLDGMTISVGGERFILPLSNVVEATFLKKEDVRELPDKSEVLARRGEYLKLLSVRRAFRMENDGNKETMAVIVDTETDGHVALRVDELLGQRQVVLKSIESNYRRVDGVSGATILGDGRVALIIDVPALIELSGANTFHKSETVH